MYKAYKDKNIAILGAGSWGLALADHCHRIGHNVSVWEFDEQAAEKLNRTRKRMEMLPHLVLHKDIHVSSDMSGTVTDADIILLVVPSHVARSVLSALSKCALKPETILVSCIKGIEINTLQRMSEIISECCIELAGQRFVVLSGPSHAEEVNQMIPTAVVVASHDLQAAERVQKAMTSKTFRFYTSQDVIGVELGGALKNVIAIAAGICDGAGFGDNTKAALQPRGLAEIARLGEKLGADPLTFGGLSGMGDLIVTCMSRHSRNRFVGEEIGKGKSLKQVLDEMSMVAEGVRTCQAAVELAKKYNVEMPICLQIYKVLFEQKSAKTAVESLMTRKVKPERWS
ncbi:NAD(P)H-dependent glycerol-3-phosphate dehydrogenase [candidate division KSB1 bacterium]|nr:NAD(P)H-dependent glycerol-3-phosphate dehydrogenase [candidate division KSB1 bacterium]